MINYINHLIIISLLVDKGKNEKLCVIKKLSLKELLLLSNYVLIFFCSSKSKNSMFTSYINRLLTIEPKKITKTRIIFWLSLSLTFALFYGLMLLQKIFSLEYIIQDDARQHVFWMQRFVDSQLFPNDLIADYFQSVAPLGYSYLYKIINYFGIHPFVFNKISPVILSLVITIYCFLLTFKIVPIPWTAFLATVILNQSLWMKDDITSGTPRAFVYPLLLAFFYYFVQNQLVPCLIILILQVLFYPQATLISGGLIFLEFILSYTQKKRINKGYLILIIFTSIIVLLYKFKISNVSPIINVEEARKLPEFLAAGRTPFFYDERPFYYWLASSRAGIFANLHIMPGIGYSAILLPFLLFTKYDLVGIKKDNLYFFLKIILVSMELYFLAHIMLFKLHLPSRYTFYTFRIIIDISAAIVVTILINLICSYFDKQTNNLPKKLLRSTLVIILVAPFIIYPSFLKSFPKGDNNYIVGKHPQIYQFFAQQPKDIMIASITREADNIPSFSGRSVLVSKEYSIPYHNDYYLNQLRPKIIDTIAAQYTTDKSILEEFINKYQIDFWLIRKDSFTLKYFKKHKKNFWLQQFQPTTRIAEKVIANQEKPILQQMTQQCKVLEDKKFIIIDVECLKSDS